jgi:7,8-dihydroneopterin aldolase/epimerase/oxygenase
MDKIIVKDLKVFARHGVNPEETAIGQQFLIDVEARADLSLACVNDELDSTVSYSAIVKTVVTVMKAQNDKLLERAAQRVADAILGQYPEISDVKICLKKPDAPISADFSYVAVEIERGRI